MHRKTIPRNLLAAAVFFVFVFSAGISEVQTAAPTPLNPGFSTQSPFPDPFHGMDQISQQQFEKQRKELNIQRQKQLTSDSAKLLALAAQLKAEVDQAGNDVPTSDQGRKAEQIEKLAHSVRDKMKAIDSLPMAPILRK